MPTARINDMEFWYEERGGGTPLVLLHGFPLDGRIWEGQLAGLWDRFRVIVPDLPGFGRSKAGKPFTLASIADDVHALLGRIGALPCVLGGLSMGGYVALPYVRTFAADLRGLILVDTRAEADSDEAKANRQKMAQLAIEQGATPVAGQMLPRMLDPHNAQIRPDLVIRLRQIMEGCPPATIANACLAMRDREDQVEFLSSIRVPTLLIFGERDAITPPAMGQAMHERIANSRLVVVPHAGHLSPMEQPNAVNEAISQFLYGLA
jgi:pimeloyl-ACP methyl ester carboxylesterase